MLTEKELKFIAYWEANRLSAKRNFKQYLKGISLGLVIGILILITIMLGWFERANMVANSKMSPIIFVLAVVGIGVFMGYIYSIHRWEMNEQQYKELQAKKHRQEQPKTTNPV